MKDILVGIALILALFAAWLVGVEMGFNSNGPHQVSVTLTCRPTAVQDVPGNPPIYTYQCEAGR